MEPSAAESGVRQLPSPAQIEHGIKPYERGQGYWQVASGKWQVASGKRQVASGKRQAASGKCGPWPVSPEVSKALDAVSITLWNTTRVRPFPACQRSTD
jgi:hypothetical protein